MCERYREKIVHVFVRRCSPCLVNIPNKVSSSQALVLLTYGGVGHGPPGLGTERVFCERRGLLFYENVLASWIRQCGRIIAVG